MDYVMSQCSSVGNTLGAHARRQRADRAGGWRFAARRKLTEQLQLAGVRSSVRLLGRLVNKDCWRWGRLHLGVYWSHCAAFGAQACMCAPAHDTAAVVHVGWKHNMIDVTVGQMYTLFEHPVTLASSCFEGSGIC